MTLIDNCRSIEIVQRSEAPNNAWRNFESHLRPKRTREILCLSHKISRKTMQPGEESFQFVMETDRLAEDLQRLGDRSVTEVRKCLISVAKFSTDDEIEVRMLNNNPRGHEGTDMIAL